VGRGREGWPADGRSVAPVVAVVAAAAADAADDDDDAAAADAPDGPSGSKPRAGADTSYIRTAAVDAIGRGQRPRQSAVAVTAEALLGIASLAPSLKRSRSTGAAGGAAVGGAT
ncbi:unnamed protein product, partial [Laminaria digitata]